MPSRCCSGWVILFVQNSLFDGSLFHISLLLRKLCTVHRALHLPQQTWNSAILQLQRAQLVADKKQLIADEMARRERFFGFWCRHLRQALGLAKKLGEFQN